MLKTFRLGCLFFMGLLATMLSSNLLQAEEQQAKIEPSKKYNLSICAIFKDEGPYFKEWIEYHKMVGVEHFYLYDNGSTDNFKEVLDPYIKEGSITLIDWPDRGRETWGNKANMWVSTTQIPAYEHACRFSTVKETKWLALIDIDEFLVPVKTDKMTDIVDKYSDYPGIDILWHVFGTSGVVSLPPNTLLIEVLHRTAPLDHSLNAHIIKTILKPECYNGFYWPPHKCLFKDDKVSIELSKNEAQINHYMNRTIDYFYRRKVKSKEKMDNVTLSAYEIEMWAKAGNDIEDEARVIDRFIPALRKRMGFDP